MCVFQRGCDMRLSTVVRDSNVKRVCVCACFSTATQDNPLKCVHFSTAVRDNNVIRVRVFSPVRAKTITVYCVVFAAGRARGSFLFLTG